MVQLNKNIQNLKITNETVELPKDRCQLSKDSSTEPNTSIRRWLQCHAK